MANNILGVVGVAEEAGDLSSALRSIQVDVRIYKDTGVVKMAGNQVRLDCNPFFPVLTVKLWVLIFVLSALFTLTHFDFIKLFLRQSHFKETKKGTEKLTNLPKLSVSNELEFK